MSSYAMPLNVLLRAIGARAAEPAPIIRGMTLDSRVVEPGDLFVALAGAHIHGLQFLDQAARRGCAAVLWEIDDGAPLEKLNAVPDLPQLGATGLRARLGSLADRFYQQPSADLQLVGVTGTNGKTSCVHLLGQTARALGKVCGTMGTLGWGLTGAENRATHTTPDALSVQAQLARLRDAGATMVAMEVSSHALDQGRVNGVRFDAAILTNLTREHLDYHQDMVSYGRVKGRLFSSAGLRFAILNQDDELGRQLLARLDHNVEAISYGIKQGQVRARDISQTATGLQFKLCSPWGEAVVRAALLGRFNIENLLAVAATLAALGWSIPEIVSALEQVEPVPGRMNLLGGDTRPLVVVDYAHTPDALQQSLEAVRAHVRGMVICVFGCGGQRDRGKRSQMAMTAEHLADTVIVTDDNPRMEDGDAIVQDILTGFTHADGVQVIRDRAAAISQAIAMAAVGDVILVAGKGHEDYQEVGRERRHFDDRLTAAAALELR